MRNHVKIRSQKRLQIADRILKILKSLRILDIPYMRRSAAEPVLIDGYRRVKFGSRAQNAVLSEINAHSLRRIS